ncbi:unnamed protein product, partial [Prorocentrum cordatum]
LLLRRRGAAGRRAAAAPRGDRPGHQARRGAEVRAAEDGEEEARPRSGPSARQPRLRLRRTPPDTRRAAGAARVAGPGAVRRPAPLRRYSGVVGRQPRAVGQAHGAPPRRRAEAGQRRRPRRVHRAAPFQRHHEADCQ